MCFRLLLRLQGGQCPVGARLLGHRVVDEEGLVAADFRCEVVSVLREPLGDEVNKFHVVAKSTVVADDGSGVTAADRQVREPESLSIVRQSFGKLLRDNGRGIYSVVLLSLDF